RVLPRAGVVQTSRRRAGQSEGVVEFPIGEESGVTGDGRAVKRQLDLAVEVNAQGVLGTVTPWVPRAFRQEVVGNAGFSGEKAQTPCRNDRVIWEIRDQQTASHDSSSDRTEAFSPLGNKDVGVGSFLTGPTRNPKKPRPFRIRPVNHVVAPFLVRKGEVRP